jgi:hypothetical protein
MKWRKGHLNSLKNWRTSLKEVTTAFQTGEDYVRTMPQSDVQHIFIIEA